MSTVINEIIEALIQVFAGVALDGRVVDSVGQPVADAEVAVRRTGFLGDVDQAVTRSDAQGRFSLDEPLPGRFVLVVRAGGVERTLPPVERPAGNLGDLRIVLPVRLAGTVGDGGANRPLDVRRVQDRLHQLGRLSDIDVTAEPIDLGALPPVDLATRPRLLTAIFDHLQASLGLRTGLIEPDGAALAALNADPSWPIAAVALSGVVGELPGAVGPVVPLNQADDLRRVQDRLHQLGLLRDDHYQTERAAPPAPVPPRTMEAIQALDRLVVGGSLHAVVPGGASARALADPCTFGLLPLSLVGSVGAGGENRPGDVRRVQDRLRRLGWLAQVDHAAEAVGVPPPPAAPVDAATIPRTLTAIAKFRQARLGAPAPVEAIVEVISPEAAALDRPPALTARDTAPSIRGLQERLRALGLLAGADFDAERINPAQSGAVDRAAIPRTLAALDAVHAQRGPLELGGGVGRGEANQPADLRRVQDRLAGLGLLAPADYARERADPAAALPPPEAELASTWAALTTLRQRVLRLPAPAVGRPWTAHPVVRADDDTHRMLRDPAYFGRFPLELTGSVGTLGWNRPQDIQALQNRLRELSVLAAADAAAEAVDPDRSGRVADGNLPRTIAAIAAFREDFLGAAAPTPGRIDPRHLTATALDQPLKASKTAVPLTGTVGQGGGNTEADVHAVQERLCDLRYLAEDDFARERQTPGPFGAAPPLPATLAAIIAWRTASGVANPTTAIEPGDVSHRRLTWPLLPRPAALALTRAVGNTTAAGANLAPEVRRVLDRLHELGFLATPAYLAERAAPAPTAALFAAIRSFQETAASRPDGIVSANGFTQRVLQDPTYATPTVTNRHAHNTSAGVGGVDLNGFPIRLQAIIWAIEHHESGSTNPNDWGATGEVPALTPNGSGTPASFGRVQMIGGSEVDLLDAHRNPQAAFYGLDTALPALRAVVAATTDYFDTIYNLQVPAPGLGAMALGQQITNYAAANLAAFQATTFLSRIDLERMFHTAQLIRRRNTEVAANPIPPGTAPDTPAMDGWINNRIAALTADPALVPSLAALGLAGALRPFVVNANALRGEHRAAFATKALFYSPQGQHVRNAMTDNDGRLGRLFVEDNYNRVVAAANNAVPPVVLTRDNEARITMRIHNAGPAGLAGYLQNPGTAVNDYVNHVWVFYTAYVNNNAVP